MGMSFATGQIPLPEHPRPDFKRPQWINLNGTWEFKFDSNNICLLYTSDAADES